APLDLTGALDIDATDALGMLLPPLSPPAAAATAAATAAAAAMIFFIPLPCIPVTTSPWIIGSPTILINNIPALNNTSVCLCNRGGVIRVFHPGQMTVYIP
ncbi:MAG: PAAR-like protein, partial [Cyanobacteria bacterium P01_F01_bin.86]